MEMSVLRCHVVAADRIVHVCVQTTASAKQ